MTPQQPATSKSASDRLPWAQLLMYVGVVLLIVAIGVLTYVLWPQQQPSAAPRSGDNGTLAPLASSSLAPITTLEPGSPPASEEGLPDRGKESAYFCTSKKFHRRVFQFSDRPDDPTFTFGSVINLSYRERAKDEGRREARSANVSMATPPNCVVEFEPSLAFVVEHPTLFRHFQPGDIDALRFNFSKLPKIDSKSADATMAYVSHLNDLKHLSISSFPITAQGLANSKLDKMRDLTTLSLDRTDVDGKDLVRFNILPQLRTLEFIDCKNAAALLMSVKSAKQLGWLTLRDDHLTDSDLKMIGESMYHLTYLDIRLNPALTVAGLRYLHNQKDLRFLELNGNPSFIPALSSMDKLRLLTLDSAGNWSEKEKTKVRQNLPQCQIVFPTASERYLVRPSQLPPPQLP